MAGLVLPGRMEEDHESFLLRACRFTTLFYKPYRVFIGRPVDLQFSKVSQAIFFTEASARVYYPDRIFPWNRSSFEWEIGLSDSRIKWAVQFRRDLIRGTGVAHLHAECEWVEAESTLNLASVDHDWIVFFGAAQDIA